MTSSKKKRGKQRKAAKLASAANNNISGDDTTAVVDDKAGSFLAAVRNGENYPTELLAQIPPGSYERLFTSVGTSFESSGILSAVFNFLQRCEDETFGMVMAGVGGNLATPSMWIKLLARASEREPSCRLQIAQNIGPLVRCMCADTKRLFFKSNKHWKEAITYFVVLIWILVRTINSEESNDTKMNIVGTLLKHEELLKTIVQWGFWGEEHRPDIAKELTVNGCSHIVSIGREITAWIIHGCYDACDDFSSREPLVTICTTPIVSKDYDPDCMVSHLSELIRRIKKATSGDMSYVLRLVERLMCCSDCVDKEVITEIIDFGTNFATNYSHAGCTANISAAMLVQQQFKFGYYNGQPSDSRAAFTLRAGLIEMCLTFIERFGGHELFGQDDDYSLSQHMQDILINVYEVSLHKKTAKAIRSKRSTIEERRVRLEQKPNITNNVKCKEILDMIRSILNLNGLYCCRCNKTLGRKEIKRCNGCNCMTYCSKACQKEDWLSGGHDLSCNKEYTEEQAGRFQGRVWPKTLQENERAAAKMKELEINITMIQLKLFLDNTETILNRARDLGIPLCDCVVGFDLRKCPPTVKVMRYSKRYNSAELEKAFDGSRSKDNITCIYRSIIYNGELDEDGEDQVLEMQRFFPHEWLSKKEKKS